MTRRTIRTTVTLQQPFVLAGVDRRYPAGAHEVQTGEETIDNLSFVAGAALPPPFSFMPAERPSRCASSRPSSTRCCGATGP